MWYQRLVEIDDSEPESTLEQPAATQSSVRVKKPRSPASTPADFQRVRLLSTLRLREQKRKEEQVSANGNGVERNYQDLSLRDMESSPAVESREMEEAILRQIREEGLLDGIDLENISFEREDEITEMIAAAYIRRQNKRARHDGREKNENWRSNIRAFASQDKFNSSDVDAHEIEGGTLRHVRKEGLLDGVGLETVEDELKERTTEGITKTSRRRKNKRTSQEAARSEDRARRRDIHSRSSAPWDLSGSNPVLTNLTDRRMEEGQQEENDRAEDKEVADYIDDSDAEILSIGASLNERLAAAVAQRGAGNVATVMDNEREGLLKDMPKAAHIQDFPDRVRTPKSFADLHPYTSSAALSVDENENYDDLESILQSNEGLAPGDSDFPELLNFFKLRAAKSFSDLRSYTPSPVLPDDGKMDSVLHDLDDLNKGIHVNNFPPTGGIPSTKRSEKAAKMRIRIPTPPESERVDATSRLHYAKNYTVESHVKVWLEGIAAADTERQIAPD